MQKYTDEETSFIKQFRDSLEQDYSGPRKIKQRFHEEITAQLPKCPKERQEQIWLHASKDRLIRLLAVQSVSRPSGNGQISLYVGDVFATPAEQWICSAFQEKYNPNGGIWISFWKNVVANSSQALEEEQPAVTFPLPNRQIGILSCNPKAPNQPDRPTIIIHGAGSQAYYDFIEESQDLWVEKAYSDALFAIRQLAKENRLGSRIAMPILFSVQHGLTYSKALDLQKDFAFRLLHQEPQIREIMITTYDEAELLLKNYHHIIEDSLSIQKDTLPNWLTNTIEHLSHDIKIQLSQIQNTELQNAVLECLGRFAAETLYLNDIAVLVRTLLEKWTLQTQKVVPQNRKNLYDSISKLRALSGRPNRTILYIDNIRELGNVGAHQAVAPHPLEKEDLITLLLGIKAMLRVHIEFMANNKF